MIVLSLPPGDRDRCCRAHGPPGDLAAAPRFTAAGGADVQDRPKSNRDTTDQRGQWQLVAAGEGAGKVGVSRELRKVVRGDSVGQLKCHR